jgi:SAM-dependent methyltransferase
MSKEKQFWNREYQAGKHLALSMEPSGDMIDFCRYFERVAGEGIIANSKVLDIGCGNGRNSAYLAETYGAHGIGFDISIEGIALANKALKNGSFEFMVRDLHEPLPAEDGSIGLVLDLMVSHCLEKEARENYIKELARVLENRGYVLFKAFLKEGDPFTDELLKKHGVKGDPNAYIHPKFETYEHVWTEESFLEYVEPYFNVEHFKKSHGHRRSDGKARKRRYFVAYLSKREDI